MLKFNHMRLCKNFISMVRKQYLWQYPRSPPIKFGPVYCRSPQLTVTPSAWSFNLYQIRVSCSLIHLLGFFVTVQSYLGDKTSVYFVKTQIYKQQCKTAQEIPLVCVEKLLFLTAAQIGAAVEMGC